MNPRLSSKSGSMTVIPTGMNNQPVRVLRTGLSFIEVLLATALLGAIMVPIMITFGASNSGIQMTSEELIAHTAALELLEQTMAVPFALLPTGQFSQEQMKNGQIMNPQLSPVTFRVSRVDGLDLERALVITPLVKNNVVRFKKVEIQITWTPRETSGNKRHITLKGLLANETEE